MTWQRTMISIEALWAGLSSSGEIGGALRVDEEHPCDFYAALDASGKPGLVLVSAAVPAALPPFEAVEIVVKHRKDGRWSLGIWLRADALFPLFARLCDDLVEASRQIAPSGAAGYVLSRLVRWRKLLQAGDSEELAPSELRGLVGELLVLQSCLDAWPATQVILGWVGPLDAPQDFVLPALRIEAKTISPGVSMVRISSADQLDVEDAALVLSVVTLASIEPDGDGISPAALVDDIRQHLIVACSPDTILDFENKLLAAGFVDLPVYERRKFRVEGIRHFQVRDTFPRLRRIDLPFGVAEVSYDIALGACTAFESELPR